MAQNNTLPPNWSWVKLGDLVRNPKDDIVDGPFGSNLKATEYKTSGTPIIRLQNIDRNYFVNKNIKFITKQKAIELKRHSYIPGDIIITKLGDPLGEACEIPKTFESGIIVADLVRVRLTDKKVDKKFLIYSINSDYVAKQFKIKTKGTTRPRVNLTHVRSLEIKLPPLPVQKKIVEKIEELFSGLDSGVASLKKAKEQIRLYRQSVLSAAFSGKLVKDEKRETKEELEAHLNGVQGVSNKKGEHLNGIQEVPEQEMLEHLPYKQVVPKAAEPKVGYDKDLPEGWKWVKLGEVSEIINGYAFKSGSFKEEGKYQVIKIGNLRPGIIRLNEKPAFIDELEDQIVNRSLLKKGDLIISLTGTRKKRDYGYVAMVTNQKNLLLNQRLAIIRLKKEYNSTYFLYLLRMDFFLDQFFKNETGNVGQGNVGINGIRESILPVPTLIEQTQIVEEIEKRFSEANNLEKAIDDSLAKSETLRQSILKQAFSGKLIMNN